jgi:hypothetical protein
MPFHTLGPILEKNKLHVVLNSTLSLSLSVEIPENHCLISKIKMPRFIN